MSTTSPEGIVACSTVVPVVCTLVVLMRFRVRSRQKAHMTFDDWAQIPALLLFVGMAISALIGVSNRAFGYNTPPCPLTKPAPSTILCSKLLFAIQILQIPALALIKGAAFSFYRRLFCPHRQGALSGLLLGLMFLTVGWAVALIITYVTACGTHPAAAWESEISYVRYCKSSLHWEEAFAISDFILDLLVLTLPLPLIWALQMSIGRKIGITGVFMLALVGFGASTARLAVYVIIANGSEGKTSVDVQRQDTQAIWFSMLETGFSLIAINLPNLWGMVSCISIDSVIRSVRSLLSLHSQPSSTSVNGPSRRYADLGGNSSTRTRSSSVCSVSHSPHVELVHLGGASAQSNTTVTRSNRVGLGDYDIVRDHTAEADLERGIRVQKSLGQTEMRLARTRS